MRYDESQPSAVVLSEKFKGLQSWADEIAAVENKEAKTKEFLLDAMLSYECP